MRLRWWLLFAILGYNALHAGAIRNLDVSDVSAETTITVHTGDTLVYHLVTWNFARNAARSNLPAFPADLNFALVTAPMEVAGEFAVTLESENRSVTAEIGNLKFNTGFFTSSGYSGEVSTLQGYLHLSPQFSQSLFESDMISITLQNLGVEIELGISPYVLRQNMFVSLSVEDLSVGALPGWVELEESQNQGRLSVYGAAAASGGGAEIPEPGSKGLLIVGGVILCGLPVLLRQFSRRGRENS